MATLHAASNRGLICRKFQLGNRCESLNNYTVESVKNYSYTVHLSRVP